VSGRGKLLLGVQITPYALKVLWRKSGNGGEARIDVHGRHCRRGGSTDVRVVNVYMLRLGGGGRFWPRRQPEL